MTGDWLIDKKDSSAAFDFSDHSLLFKKLSGGQQHSTFT